MAVGITNRVFGRNAPRFHSCRSKRHSDELMSGTGFRRTAVVCAASAFSTTSLLALAAADWPPPAGFLWLEAVLAALSVIVYFRVRARLAGRARGRRVPIAALEGAVAALVSGLALLAANAGDPDVTPVIRDHIVWLSILAVVGGLSAQALWSLAVWIDRSPPPHPRPEPTNTSQ